MATPSLECDRTEVITTAQMGEIDRRAIAAGPLDGYGLMRRAGAAVAEAIVGRYPRCAPVQVLCGPGNNGGDGYVVAELLRREGRLVELFAEGDPRDGSDAAIAAADCLFAARPLSEFQPAKSGLVVDALYGAGLARPLGAAASRAARATVEAGLPVVAVDLPSGIGGDSGVALGAAFAASLTVTFVRPKPGHLLQPGRAACGELVVADIGIADNIVRSIDAACFENGPALWNRRFPRPALDTHKYARGHVVVVSGPPSATGAARLSAIAAARAGAGAVTLLSPAAALAINAAHLTSIMVRQADALEEVLSALSVRPPAALVYGPGLEAELGTAERLAALIAKADPCPSMVVDASALTALGKCRALLMRSAGSRRCDLVLTPHEGEFARLFPQIDHASTPSKLERARMAAREAGAVLVYKGPDTVIAGPDGRAAINSNGVPWLATAGSGDVLSGLIAGLIAQRMPAFEAACAAVWLHAEAASRFGPGLIAEDIPGLLPPLLRDVLDYPQTDEDRQ